jgi:hypothetical protein
MPDFFAVPASGAMMAGGPCLSIDRFRGCIAVADLIVIQQHDLGALREPEIHRILRRSLFIFINRLYEIE